MELPVLFKTLVRKMTHEWNKRVADPLSMTQFRLLYILNTQGSRKTTDLADTLGVTNGAVTGMADKLIKNGYIERHKSESDRRVVYLALTDHGKERVASMLEQQRETLSAFFSSLPEEDIGHLKRIFTVMLEQFDEKEKE